MRRLLESVKVCLGPSESLQCFELLIEVTLKPQSSHEDKVKPLEVEL